MKHVWLVAGMIIKSIDKTCVQVLSITITKIGTKAARVGCHLNPNFIIYASLPIRKFTTDITHCAQVQ